MRGITLVILLFISTYCLGQIGLNNSFNTNSYCNTRINYSNNDWVSFAINKKPDILTAFDYAPNDVYQNLMVNNWYATAHAIGDNSALKYLEKCQLNNVSKGDINWSIGNNYFGLQKYYEAIYSYTKVLPAYLTNTQIVRKNFNLAYSYLSTNQPEKVEPLFASLINIDGAYFTSGNYYYGLLKYYNKDFDAALSSFNLIANDKFYKKVLPFYLAEINYNKGDKEKALSIAQASLSDNNNGVYNKGELNLLASQILLEKQAFKESLPYLKKYISGATKIRNEDLFQLGYTCYKLEDYDQALKVLDKISGANDSLELQSNYLQGECYLVQGKKNEARYQFQQASAIPIYNGLNELSRFYVTKLSFELKQDEDALNGAYNLIKIYPNSKYKKESIKIVTNLLEASDNYEAALSIAQELGNDAATKATAQKLNYNYGIKKINENDLSKAYELFSNCVQIDASKEITTKAKFWQAEINYRKKDFNKAIELASAFLKDPSPKDGNVSDNSANLINAYSYMKLGNVAKARESIDQIISHNDEDFMEVNQKNLLIFKNTLEELKVREERVNNYIILLASENSKLEFIDNIIDSLNKDVYLNEIQKRNLALIGANYKLKEGNTIKVTEYLQSINKWENTNVYYLKSQILISKKDSAATTSYIKSIININQTNNADNYLSKIALLQSNIFSANLDATNEAIAWAIYAKKMATEQEVILQADTLIKKLTEQLAKKSLEDLNKK